MLIYRYQGGEGRGVLDGCDGLAVRGLPPPLDPSTALRVSGLAWGWVPRGSGAGMTEVLG